MRSYQLLGRRVSRNESVIPIYVRFNGVLWRCSLKEFLFYISRLTIRNYRLEGNRITHFLRHLLSLGLPQSSLGVEKEKQEKLQLQKRRLRRRRPRRR
jgi:hypothetical protein